MVRGRLRRASAFAIAMALVAVTPTVAVADGLDVAAENARTGTAKWQLPAKSFDEKTLAFADRASVLPGDTFGLYVSCAAADFTVNALRIGDYEGRGARSVWRSERTPCTRQSGAHVDPRTNTATARWHRSLDVDTTAWPEGMYVLKVMAASGSGTYVDLVVRSASAEGRILMVSSTQTFAAYNQWGGANAYRGKRGFSTRARVVSYDRPQTWGMGSGKFLGYEAPLVQVAEGLGLPLAYATDIDLDTTPRLVDGASSIVFGGHAEYWTQKQRDTVMRARAKGTNLLFFGANTAYWRVRLEPSILGARRTMAVYKSRSADPNTAKPSIRFRDTGQPDSELTAVTYNCFPARGPFTVTHADSWVFSGTGAVDGQAYAGIIGPEIDKLVSHTAADDVLASSRITCGGRPLHSTMVLRRDSSGAMTFAVGTMGWVSKVLRGQAPAASVRFVRTVTENVLRAATTRGLGEGR